MDKKQQVGTAYQLYDKFVVISAKCRMTLL